MGVSLGEGVMTGLVGTVWARYEGKSAVGMRVGNGRSIRNPSFPHTQIIRLPTSPKNKKKGMPKRLIQPYLQIGKPTHDFPSILHKAAVNLPDVNH